MAFKSREHAFKQPYGSVFGSVELWGEVAEHELGYRAQHARIISIDFIAGHIDHPDHILSMYGMKGKADGHP